MTGDTQPARMSVMHVEIPMQTDGRAKSNSGHDHHHHHHHQQKAPTVIEAVHEEPKVVVDVSVPTPGSAKAPTVKSNARSDRPKPPPIVRPLPRAASVHTVVDVEPARHDAARIVVDEYSSQGTARGPGTTVVVDTHVQPEHQATETVTVITPAPPAPISVAPPTIVDLVETASIAPSAHSHHSNALGLIPGSDMPFQIPRLSRRSHHSGHHGHHRRSLHATVTIPMQAGPTATAMAKAESPPHAVHAEIPPAPEVMVAAPRAETVVVAPAITARASVTNSPPRPTVMVTPPTVVGPGQGKGKKKKNKKGGGGDGAEITATAVVEDTIRTDVTVAPSETVYPRTVAQTIPSPPRPIIQIVQMPPAPPSSHSHRKGGHHRHTHRFPHSADGSASNHVPASVGPLVFITTERTPAPPSNRGSPHMHTIVHHPGQTEQITVLPDETEIIRQTTGSSPGKKSGKKKPSSDKGEHATATPLEIGVETEPAPAPGVTRIEIRPVLQNSAPVYTQRVMMRGPDVGKAVEAYPVGNRFTEIRPIPIIDYRSFFESPAVVPQPLPEVVVHHQSSAPAAMTEVRSQHDYLDHVSSHDQDHGRTSRSGRRSGHQRRSGDEGHASSDKKHRDGDTEVYRRGSRGHGDGHHRRSSRDRHRHRHGTDTASVTPTPRWDSSRSAPQTGEGPSQPTDSHHQHHRHYHHRRHHHHHHPDDDESIPVYRPVPDVTPPADRNAKYAYPPSYDQIKAREEKAKEKEAEKAAAKASKGVPFPPGGYLAMGNQMYMRPPPLGLGLGMYGAGMGPGMGFMRPPFGMPFGRGFF